MAKTETANDRFRARQQAYTAQGAEWRDTIGKALSRADWEKCFDLHEGRIPPGKCDEHVRTLATRPLVDIFRQAIYEDHVGPPDAADNFAVRSFVDMVSRTRGVSGGSVSATVFSNRIDAWVADGFREVPNSLGGVFATADLTTFHPSPVMLAQDVHNLKPLPKGGKAQSSQFDVQSLGDQQIYRMARALTIDEQEFVSAAPGSLSQNIAQLGRSGTRCFLDWAFALILENPVLDQDGKQIFCTDHNNVVTGALSDFNASTPTANAGPLQTAIGMIRRQHLTLDDGQAQHMNLEPKILIVTPELEVPARRLLREIMLFDEKLDLELRVESRLTNIPVRNPLTGVVRTGSPGNWLLSADSNIAPWLLRATLAGQTTPRLTVYALGRHADDMGQWGLQCDMNWDFGVKLIDWRGVVFGNGTT